MVGPFKHLVVIYEENHSFDNLYGGWGKVDGQKVDGLQRARPSTTEQRAQDGTPYRCLLQNDVNLTSPSPLATTCTDPAQGVSASAFKNRPFTNDDYIKAQDTTCPPPGVFAANGVLKGQREPGGCTRDLVHSPTRGVHDAFGPGTRVPALLVSTRLHRSGVDHTVYESTSILATIEHGLGLAPLSSRDARVADLRPALRVGGVRS